MSCRNKGGEMINKLDFDETIKIRELAEILGISERQIQRLAKEGVIKKNDKGKYLFYQSVKDYIDYLRELESTPQQLQEEKLKNEIDYLKTRDRKEKIKSNYYINYRVRKNFYKNLKKISKIIQNFKKFKIDKNNKICYIVTVYA